MTVSSQNLKVIYSGNSSNINFPITFNYLTNISNVGVYLTDVSGVLTKLINTQYTYDPDTVKIIYPIQGIGLSPLPTGAKLTLVREQQLTQEVDLLNQGPFTAETVEGMSDKLTLLVQELLEKILRCVSYPVDQNPSETSTTAFLSTLQALQAAINASTANAATSETNAHNSELAAASSASAASGSASSASTSATNAASSAASISSSLSSHTGATTGAHAASAISFTPTGNTSSTDIQLAIQELQGDIDVSAVKFDTYANLVTYASTASNAKLCYATDTNVFYHVSSNSLKEFSIVKTINGTVTTVQKTVGTSAVRATVAGTAPSASRQRLKFKPSKNNTGAIYYGGSGVTTANGTEIIGPDPILFDWDISDYYLISDTAGQTVEVMEVI